MLTIQENSPCILWGHRLENQTVDPARTSSGLRRRPAPRKERPVRPVPQIEAVLAVVAILANYGRHLAQTLEKRVAGRGFATIARFFGTVAPDTILAHIHRGLLRAMALQRMLKFRAQRGRDLKVLAPRGGWELPAEDEETEAAAASAPPEALTPEQDAAAQDAAAQRAARLAGERLARRIAASEPLTLDTLPSMAKIMAEVGRSSIGRTVAEICRDLGISALLCDGMFWNALCDAVEWYRGSLGNLVIDIYRRERQFAKEEWKRPGMDLPEETRAGVRRVLGFFIGEEPVDPFEIVSGPGAGIAAVATGPP